MSAGMAGLSWLNPWEGWQRWWWWLGVGAGAPREAPSYIALSSSQSRGRVGRSVCLWSSPAVAAGPTTCGTLLHYSVG